MATKEYPSFQMASRKAGKRVCPQCRSTDVTLDTGGQTGKWLCKRCGYTGVLVIEED